MPKVDLMLGDWNQLSDERRQFIATQLSRYFLSPLLSVDAIVPVGVDYFGHHLSIFDILIGGEWLRFVPGLRAVPLGIETPAPAAMAPVLAALGEDAAAHLSPTATVDMPPMLVARASVASDEEIIGTINLTTQVFAGDHFAYMPVKGEVLGLLSQGSPDPFTPASWAPTLTGEHVVLRLAGEHQYQVALKQNWHQAQLEKRLSGFGFALPDEREYEYLMSGGLSTLFGWGNRLPDSTMQYVPNRFGLTVPVVRAGAEIVRGAYAKSAPVVAGASGAALLPLSPFYRTTASDFSQMRYRKIAKIELT